VRIDECPPRVDEARPQIPRELRGHLAHGLRLPGQLADVVAIVDGSLAESFACMMHNAIRPNDVDVVGANVRDDIETCPLAGHRVHAAFDADERALRDARRMRASGVEWCDRQRQRLPSLGGEARRVMLGIEPCKERGAHGSEIVAARNRHQVLQANRLAARFDAALVVASPGAAEACLEEVVRRQRLEARSEHSLRADERPGHGRLEVDFSYRALFTPDTPEKEIQRWTASSVRLVSRGQYSVVRENEVDDDKEVDISVLADGVGRIPIEIKPLGPYSLNALRACISDQLYGRYMRPSEVKYGVLLVVRQVDNKWDIDGKDGGFEDLVAALRAFANDFGNRHSKVIAVETIDLLLQSS
jgi:hypothetical protein